MDLGLLEMLVEGMGGNGSDGRDKGSIFPRSDAEDVQKGARFIPFQVTDLRRAGGSAPFITPCRNPCCWFWQLPDGSRIYHYESGNKERLKKEHGGTCPVCNNNHLTGGKMSAKTASAHKQNIPVTNTMTPENVRKAAEAAFELEDNIVEKQEILGQTELLTHNVLPSDVSSTTRVDLESAGVIFGKQVADDPLFTYATLPEGWTKVAMDDNRWIEIVDENGKVQAQIFYKASLHDRKATLYGV